jgi:four helix bundle protein
MSNDLKRKGIDFDIITQFRKAGTSVGANVREAKSSSSRKELNRYYEISLRSANETEYWLEVLDKGYDISTVTHHSLFSELGEIRKVIGKIVVNLKNSN